MRSVVGALFGCGAVLLLTAPVRAEEPARGDGSGTQLAQSDRSRGFSGFPDWDSRFGGYDRSRRDSTADDNRRADDRRPPPRRDPDPPGPGFGRGGSGGG